MKSLLNDISFRNFFHLYLLVAVTIPLLLLGGIGVTISAHALKEGIIDADQRQVYLAEYMIKQHLQRPLEDLQFISALIQYVPNSEIDKIQNIVETAQNVHQYFVGIQIADKDGRIIAISPKNESVLGTDVSGHKYYNQTIKSNSPYWGASYIYEQFDIPVSSISLRQDDYVITVFLSLATIGGIGNQEKGDSPARLIFITDQDGGFIVHPDKQKVMSREYDMRYLSNIRSWNGDMITEEVEYKGEKFIANVIILPEKGWKIALYTPISSIEGPIKQMAVILLLLTIVVTLFAILSGSKLSNRISNALKGLVSSVDAVGKGEYEVSTPKTNYKEFNKLADSFELMAEEIRDREKDLKNAESYISNIINSMPSVLVSVNSDLLITQWNMTAEEETGVKAEDAKGKSLIELFPYMQTEADKIIESIESREVKYNRKKPLYLNNKTNYGDITIFPLIANGVQGAVIRVDDVTDRVKMEEMMVQSEKMLSIGGLAAGMAHEINNPLAGMMQTADVIQRRLVEKIDMPANKKAAEDAGISTQAISKFMYARDIPRMVETIKESGKRAAAIVTNMLAFARQADNTKSTINVNQLLENTLVLAITDYDMKKKYDFKLIKIEKHFNADLPLLICEKSKIQQVILNVLRNSAQALQDADIPEPVILVRTSSFEDGKMIKIEIEDNGPGMDEEISKKVFEPFFTTKPVGQGTGLGLSVSYFIITENHGGDMRVISKPGKGTKFIISLPTKGNRNG